MHWGSSMCHVTWTANACYTSDLCVSSHDLCDMRAQCTTFWTPPLEVEFQLKLQFPSRVLCSVGHYTELPRFRFQFTTPYFWFPWLFVWVDLQAPGSLFDASVLWIPVCSQPHSSHCFVLLFCSCFQHSGCPTKAIPGVESQLHLENEISPVHDWSHAAKPSPLW